MSFITNFVSWIKKFNLKKWFKGLVDGDEQAAQDLNLTFQQSNDFVNNIKAQLKSPSGDFITMVIPGDWDNELRAKAIKVLEQFTGNMAALTGCFTGGGTVGEQLTCVYAKVLSLNDVDEEKSFWIKLAAFSGKVFADGKITISDAAIAAKFVYDLITNKKEVEPEVEEPAI